MPYTLHSSWIPRICLLLAACGGDGPSNDASTTDDASSSVTEGGSASSGASTTTSTSGGSSSSATTVTSGATDEASATAADDSSGGSTEASTTDGSASEGTASSTEGTSSASTGSSGDDSTGGMLDACGQAPGQLLGPTMPWNTPIDDAALAADSDDIIAYLEANVQSDARFQIDFSITVLEADAATTKYDFDPTAQFYAPDCDPAPVPLPAGGHIEGENAYACDGGGDCHLLVVNLDECRLYEQWRCDFVAQGDFQGGCMAIWTLDQAYDETLRGDYCTSADAGGFPIAAMLFDADEVDAGTIPHALRFIVPNADIRDDIFVRPATHSTPATAGPGDAPPYGARLRLRGDTDISGLEPAAQVVAQALMTYGMVLADAGNITFTAESDDFTTAKWSDLGLGPHDLKDLQWDDFEVVDGGPEIVWSAGDCDRVQIQN